MESTTNQDLLSSIVDDNCWGPQCASWGPNSPTNFGGPNYAYPDQKRLFVFINGIFRLIVGIFGLPMNAFLAFITLRNKELWTTSGILLGIVAVCDAIVSLMPFISFGCFDITGNIDVPQTTCFHAMSPAIVAFSFMFPLLFALGADRFLSIALPLWHRQLVKKYYILFCMLPSAAVSLYVYISGLINAYTNNSLPVRFQCNLENNLVGPYGTIVGNISLAFNLVTIGCYLLLFIYLKYAIKSQKHQNMIDSSRKVIKSLTVIVVIYTGGWVITQLIKFNQQRFLPPNLLSQIVSTTAGGIIAISQTINTPVLYFTSKLYRTKMQQSLDRLNWANYKHNMAGMLIYHAPNRVQQMPNNVQYSRPIQPTNGYNGKSMAR